MPALQQATASEEEIHDEIQRSLRVVKASPETRACAMSEMFLVQRLHYWHESTERPVSLYGLRHHLQLSDA